MTRITIADCIKQIDNHFELTLVASYRARQLSNNVASLVQGKNDKPTVAALKEIALGKIDRTILD